MLILCDYYKNEGVDFPGKLFRSVIGSFVKLKTEILSPWTILKIGCSFKNAYLSYCYNFFYGLYFQAILDNFHTKALYSNCPHERPYFKTVKQKL